MIEGVATGSSWSFIRALGTRLAAAGLVATFVMMGTGVAAGATSPNVASNQDATSVDALANVELPPAMGETSLQVYVPHTGHSVSGVMLDYWRATGAESVYGDPISEPFAAANGYYSQAFERGVFQYRPDVLYTVDPIVRLMPHRADVPWQCARRHRPSPMASARSWRR